MGDVFDDAVKTCEFYSSEERPIHVDWGAKYIVLGDGDFVVDPILEDDVTVYIVKGPSGDCRLVSDLDDYFRSTLSDWWGDTNGL